MNHKEHSDNEYIDFPFGRIFIEFKTVAGARSVRMRLKSKDEVLVTKPIFVAKSKALELVRKNADWLQKTRISYKEPVSISKFLVQNPYLNIFGKTFKVFLKPDCTDKFSIIDDKNHELVLAYNTEEDLQILLNEIAKKSISKKVDIIATEHSFHYKKITVRNQQSRWASYSASGTLSFNWRMVLLDFDLQRYVIMHEFAHTKFMDHSVSFWIYLSRICPHAKKLDKMLDKVSSELMRVGL